jgi:hypothetical protein
MRNLPRRIGNAILFFAIGTRLSVAAHNRQRFFAEVPAFFHSMVERPLNVILN